MMRDSWIVSSLGLENVQDAEREAARRRLHCALAVDGPELVPDSDLHFVANGLELQVITLLESGKPDALRTAAAAAFQASRVLPRPQSPIEAAEALIRLGCLGVLGDRGADFRRLLLEQGLPSLPLGSRDWGCRVWATILDIWLRLFRKCGWADLDDVEQGVARLRSEQLHFEKEFLSRAEESRDPSLAWSLVANYHLAKAAEILGAFHSTGSVDGRFDVREQL